MTPHKCRPTLNPHTYCACHVHEGYWDPNGNWIGECSRTCPLCVEANKPENVEREIRAHLERLRKDKK